MSVSEHNNPAAVVLLASEGPARERLRQAVANAGGLIVLDAEPARVDAGQVLACNPAAVVIALDASTELVLETLEPVLAQAGVTVLLEEADVAAARQGWDAQRWERHLAAKLQGHGNVLPPGAEEESPSLPEPGRPQTPAQRHAGAPMQAHLAQAMELADTLPVDDGPVGGGLALTDDLDLAEPALSLEAPPQWDLPVLDTYEEDTPAIYQPPAMPEAVPSLDELLAAAAPSGLDEADASVSVPAPAHTPVEDLAPVAAPVMPPPLPPLEMPAAPAPVENRPAASGGLSQWSLVDFDDSAAVADVPVAAAPAVGNWDLSGLSLLDEDEDKDKEQEAAASAAAVVPARAVALIMAGIGGPDAIRRLLATLPAEGMPGAVLVQLRLDGGRYANLVTQLERVCAAPVKLAQVGEVVQAGHVYVLAEDITLSGHEALRFAHLPEMATVLPDIPATGSAVLMLSGADADQTDAVLALGMRGAWVAGQSGEGCYDPAAASALAVAGMQVGEPAWLGRELLARWGL